MHIMVFISFTLPSNSMVKTDLRITQIGLTEPECLPIYVYLLLRLLIHGLKFLFMIQIPNRLDYLRLTNFFEGIETNHTS